jgi:hypothetical protein
MFERRLEYCTFFIGRPRHVVSARLTYAKLRAQGKPHFQAIVRELNFRCEWGARGAFC